MGAYLICEDGPTAGSVASLLEGDQWILGRDPKEASFVIEDPMVSRRHAIIRLQDEIYTIENLSEVNPVLLNDEPFEGIAELHEDDTLQIGNNYFRFSFEDPREEHAEPRQNRVEMDDEFDSKNDDALFSKLPFIAPMDNRFVIKVISGPNQGAEFGMNVGETHVIGKDPASSDIIFQDLSVSRQHARISISAEGVLSIEDLDSRNGVLINGLKIDRISPLTTQDLISVGTTSFLVIDREGAQDTIFSPPSPALLERDLERIGHPMDGDTPVPDYLRSSKDKEVKNWKETFIPTRHLFIASLFSFLLFIGFISFFALFRSQAVVINVKDEIKEIDQTMTGFNNVQYSFNPQTGKIFLVGHVLTDIEHAELVYLVRSLTFIKNIEDNVIVDEGVWSAVNALLIKNPNWRGVMIASTSAGRFVARGYVATEDELTRLQEYLNLNFPYLNLLDNQVVAEDTLQTMVGNLLIEQGFVNVSFQFGAGDLILTGRVNSHEESNFHHLVNKHLATLSGVRQVKNLVIFVSASTARIDLSEKYKVTGTSKFGEMNKFVLINGRILAKGDLLDGMTITEISSSEVELDQNGIKYKISYNQ